MLKKIILAAAMALVLTACSNSDSEPMTVPSSASTTTTVTTTTTAPKPVESTTTTTTTSVTTTAPEEDITTTTTEAQTETTTTTTTTTTALTTTTAAPKPSVTFTATSKTVYATTYAPFRTTPTDNGTVICYISPNAKATVTSVSSDNKWYGVTYNGMKGYALTSQTTSTAPKQTQTSKTTTTTTTAKATQPAKQKTALDLAFEALVIGNSTAQQRELIRQYVIDLVTSRPLWKSTNSYIDESLYPMVDAQGNPCYDESVAVDWGNSSFTIQVMTDTYTSNYRAHTLPLDELARLLREDFEEYSSHCRSGRYNFAFYKNRRGVKVGYEVWNFTAMY